MQWKTIENYPRYQVSDTGKVRNRDTGKILKPTIHHARNRFGYALVYIYSNKKRKCFSIHRLVASAFIPNPNNYPEVNHKDENSLNNNVTNLEWCSREYNMNYGTLKERQRINGLNTPWKGCHHTKETRNKMSMIKKGIPSKSRKKVVIEGVEYSSYTSAMKELHISTRAFYRMLKKGSDNYV